MVRACDWWDCQIEPADRWAVFAIAAVDEANLTRSGFRQFQRAAPAPLAIAPDAAIPATKARKSRASRNQSTLRKFDGLPVLAPSSAKLRVGLVARRRGGCDQFALHRLIHTLPTFPGKLFERAIAHFILHPRRAIDPIAR